MSVNIFVSGYILPLNVTYDMRTHKWLNINTKCDGWHRNSTCKWQIITPNVICNMRTHKWWHISTKCDSNFYFSFFHNSKFRVIIIKVETNKSYCLALILFRKSTSASNVALILWDSDVKFTRRSDVYFMCSTSWQLFKMYVYLASRRRVAAGLSPWSCEWHIKTRHLVSPSHWSVHRQQTHLRHVPLQ